MVDMTRTTAPGIGELRPGRLKPRRQLPPASARPPGKPGPLRWMVYALLLLCLPALVLLPMRWLNPPITSYMLQSEAPLQNRDWLTYASLGPDLPLAAVAAEDQKFPHHFGFDLQALAKVMNAPGAPSRGASTISQQTSKNLFLWPGGYVRKALEAWITLWLEALWPKTRILEVYLNVAEFAPGVYGAGAGARHHFGVAPTQLTPDQAARLVALLPSPRRYTIHDAHVQERSRWIVQQMEQLGNAHLPH